MTLPTTGMRVHQDFHSFMEDIQKKIRKKKGENISITNITKNMSDFYSKPDNLGTFIDVVSNGKKK